MKNNLTELVFILDRSGSMSGLEKDTVGGFNSMIEKQKELEGEAIISTVLFNHETNKLHNRINIKEIKELSLKDYQVRGTTALLDAIGKTIKKTREIYAETLLEERPSKVLFVITTDGMENSSTMYSYSHIKEIIESVKAKYNWEFIFMGANIDAIDEASRLGIDPNRAVRYHSDKVGITKNFAAVSEAMATLRMSNEIKKEWKKDIVDDYKNRRK